MLINVTQQHIDNGLAGHERECPIALAMLDAGCSIVYVGETDAEFTYNGDEYIVELPKEACDFIECFDEEDPINHPVEPFTFEINLD